MGFAWYLSTYHELMAWWWSKCMMILTLSLPIRTIVPNANSLDPDETPSNLVSHPDQNCLTPKLHFHQLWASRLWSTLKIEADKKFTRRELFGGLRVKASKQIIRDGKSICSKMLGILILFISTWENVLPGVVLLTRTASCLTIYSSAPLTLALLLLISPISTVCVQPW